MKKKIKDAVWEIIKSKGWDQLVSYDEVLVFETKDKRHGDYSSNIAFVLYQKYKNLKSKSKGL